MRTDDLHLHVRGESTYVDDLPSPAGCLVALFLMFQLFRAIRKTGDLDGR